MRADGRHARELRNISLESGVNKYADGSAMIRLGDTVVYCTASIENRVPPFLRGYGSGWVSAEYSMLPRATQDRNQRDIRRGMPSGRSSEIQRLIGRSMRAAVHLGSIGERTVLLDCDVLQAAGGTRTASVTAAFVCLVDALRKIASADGLKGLPLAAHVAAVSVGLVEGSILLDLSYEEDKIAEADCNVVMTGSGDFVEVQCTGEKSPFSRKSLDCMLSLAQTGLETIFSAQREALRLSEAEARLFDSLNSRAEHGY
ncbi:MAG: ribonuclease PH [Synergistaceae bacterium]|nr:ribonuclease PH [Synergistaceae bacterium]